MAGEQEIYNILWGLGGAFLGVALSALFFIFAENNIKIKALNLIYKGKFGKLEVMTDNHQVTTAIINKQKDETKKVFNSVFQLDKSQLILKDGISTLHYHISNCTSPASWRPYDEIRFIYLVPNAVRVVANIPIKTDKKGENKTIQQEVILMGDQMTPFQLEGTQVEEKNDRGETVVTMKEPPLWKVMNQEVKRFEPIAKPSEFASLIACNEAEMETNALLMKIKQLEELVKWVMICVGANAINIVICLVLLYWVNTLNGEVGELKTGYSNLNATIGTLTAPKPVMIP